MTCDVTSADDVTVRDVARCCWTIALFGQRQPGSEMLLRLNVIRSVVLAAAGEIELEQMTVRRVV